MTHAQPTGPGNRPGFRVITFAAVFIVAAAGVGVLGAYLLTGKSARSGPPAPVAATGKCAPNAILVNPCRPWLGAAASGNPGAPASKVAQFDYLERLVGQRLDIFRDYHSAPGSNALGDLPLNSDELQLARQPGTYVDVNWKPARPSPRPAVVTPRSTGKSTRWRRASSRSPRTRSS